MIEHTGLVAPGPAARGLMAQNLSCVRGERTLFSGLSFAVEPGRALAIVGPNGVGKSSLLRILAGLLPPAAGEVMLAGGDREASVGERAHYLGHRDALKPSLSVEENLLFWARFLGGQDALKARLVYSEVLRSPLPSGEVDMRSMSGEGLRSIETSEPPHPNPLPAGERERNHLSPLRNALAAVGLDTVADLPAGYLSAGQRRRLSIARLLAIPRPLWLLDEPLTALDAAFQARLADLMGGHLAADGLIVAATHAPLGVAAEELALGAPAAPPGTPLAASRAAGAPSPLSGESWGWGGG